MDSKKNKKMHYYYYYYIYMYIHMFFNEKVIINIPVNSIENIVSVINSVLIICINT